MLTLDRPSAEEIIRALSDDYSRRIILSIMSKSEPIEEISREQGIPISTCYRRVRDLLAQGIVKPDKTIIEEDGKKYICYKAAFKNATINLVEAELTVDFVVNKDDLKMEALQNHDAVSSTLDHRLGTNLTTSRLLTICSVHYFELGLVVKFYSTHMIGHAFTIYNEVSYFPSSR